MKKLAAALLILLAACTQKPEKLRPGDLVFVGIPMDYRLDSLSSAIGAATSRDSLNIIHVAIADVDSAGVWIIDATIRHGVDRHPLDTFLCDFTLGDGSLPQFFVMRLRDSRRAAAYVANARKFTGLAYNTAFVPCDTALYCSELVRDSYRRSDGGYIFSEAPMNFCAEDGTMPLYWQQLFALIGQEVPQGVPGTNPKAMMAEPVLRPVEVDIVPAGWRHP